MKSFLRSTLFLPVFLYSTLGSALSPQLLAESKNPSARFPQAVQPSRKVPNAEPKRAPSAMGPEVEVIRVAEEITVGVSEYIDRALRVARAKKSPALIIELDTPGGFLEATREIVQSFLNANDLIVVVWVKPQGARAASAGSMITMAAHYAAMSPSTSIGAATPINGGGGDIGKDLRAKIQNDTVSFVTGIAEKRGRNAAWAKLSVTEAASLNATDALKENVIDGIFSTREELWAGVRQKFKTLPEHPTFTELDHNLRENFLGFLSHPDIAYGLLALGALGIYVEMTHPGVMVPGAVGVLSLALGAITMKIIPIRPGAILLMLLGLVLFGVELLTPFPTYGIAGIGGSVCLFLSGIFLLDTSQTDLKLNMALWLPMFVAMTAFMLLLGLAAVRALKNKSYVQGFQAFLNVTTEVQRVISKDEATVQLNGELWKALWLDESPGALPPPSTAGREFKVGQKVKVVAQKGLVVYVTPLEVL